MTTLFLDDNMARQRWAAKHLNPTVQAADASGAIAALSSGGFDVVYLDHDLGDETYQDEAEENSGSGVVRWIVANKPAIGRVVVHSLNAPAANRMVQCLRDAGYEARYRPFLLLIRDYE